MAAEPDSVDDDDSHGKHRRHQKSPTPLCGERRGRQRNHHQVNGQEPQVHRHRPTRVFQRGTGDVAQAHDEHNCRHQPDVDRRGSEHPGESMPQPGLARHTVGIAPMRPGHCSGVAGNQKERRHGLERPRQPLGPRLVEERVLPTEISVVISHRSGQPMAQHDEDHARNAVEIHRQIAGRAHHFRGAPSDKPRGGVGHDQTISPRSG